MGGELVNSPGVNFGPNSNFIILSFITWIVWLNFRRVNEQTRYVQGNVGVKIE